MSTGAQVCLRCGKCEHGRTGPANAYVCVNCHRLGYRVDSLGHVTGPWPVIEGAAPQRGDGA